MNLFHFLINFVSLGIYGLQNAVEARLTKPNQKWISLLLVRGQGNQDYMDKLDWGHCILSFYPWLSKLQLDPLPGCVSSCVALKLRKAASKT